jgi:PAS domain S-box-containing protein
MDYTLKKEVLDLLVEAVLIIRNDYTIEYANEKALKLLEKPVHDVVGKTCYNVLENRMTPCKNCPASFHVKTKQKDRNNDPNCISKSFVITDQLIISKSENKLLLVLGEKKASGPELLSALKSEGADDKIIHLRSILHFIELLPLPAMITSADNKILYTNAHWLEKFTYSLEEIENKPLQLLFPINTPDDKSGILISTGKAELFDNETILLCDKNDEQYIFSSHVSKVNSAEGSFYIWMLRNITTDEESLEELKKREQYLRSIFRAAPVGIGVVVNRIFYFINKRISEITGYSASELIGHSARILYPDEDEFKKVGEIKYREIGSKGTGSVETRWQCKDGTIKDILLSSTPIEPENLTHGVTFTALDITVRKKAEFNFRQSERKYKSLIEDAPDAIIIADAETGKLIEVNQKALELTGYCYDELIGVHQSKLHPAELEQNIMNDFRRVAAGEKILTYSEVIQKSGHRIPVEINPSYFIEESGRRLLIGFFRDLTQRLEWQKALAESESKYEVIFESVKEGIVFFNPKSRRFLYANPAMCDFLEYAREEILLLSTEKIHPPKNYKEIQTTVNEILEGTRQFAVDVPCLTRNRKIVYADLHATYIMLQGEPLIAAFFTNSTQRKLTENKLKQINRELEQANMLFRTIAENIPDIILRVDTQFKCLYVNPNAFEYAGIESDQFIGKRLSELNLDQEFTKNREKDFERVLLQKEALQTVLNVNTGNKRSILEWRMVPEFDDTHKVVSILNLVRDVTSVKKTEAELHNIFNLSADLICIVATTGKFIKINPAFELLLGYPEQELLNHSSFKFIHGDDIQMTKETIELKLSKNESLFSFENRIKCKDGSYKWLSWVIQPMGEENLLFAVGRNVTEQRNALKELVEAKTRAEESDKLKSAFLANMSHEIRTPMNAIMGFSSLLKRENLTQEQRNHYVHVINNRSEDLLHILNDILDISRIESGQIHISKERFSINKMLVELFEIFHQKLESHPSKKINLNLGKKAGKDHDFLFGDPLRIKQVITNLIDNAIKFTEEGEVKFGCVERKNEVQFYVSDTGIGIPKHMHENIFERFRQAEESITRKFGGNGLGLAISKALVEMMEGKIWVDSVEGKGASFYFTIPVSNRDQQPEEVTKNKIGAGINLTGKRILVVEDEPLSREFLNIVLQQAQAKVTFARSGGEALIIFENDPAFDVILMDVQLPDINGYEVTRRIRKKDAKIPIIAQTAFAMSEDHVKSVEAGCNEYLSKPVRSDDLLATIVHVLTTKK